MAISLLIYLLQTLVIHSTKYLNGIQKYSYTNLFSSRNLSFTSVMHVLAEIRLVRWIPLLFVNDGLGALQEKFFKPPRYTRQQRYYWAINAFSSRRVFVLGKIINSVVFHWIGTYRNRIDVLKIYVSFTICFHGS